MASIHQLSGVKGTPMEGVGETTTISSIEWNAKRLATVIMMRMENEHEYWTGWNLLH